MPIIATNDDDVKRTDFMHWLLVLERVVRSHLDRETEQPFTIAALAGTW